MNKFLLSIFVSLLIFSAIKVNAEGIVNSGFIPGQIWYSKPALIEGDTVNIHTAVWNGEKQAITVKVEFYDKNVILGNREVVVSPSELKDISVSWKITSGDHVISAKIISSAVTVSGKKETVTLDRKITSNDKQFIAVVVKNNSGEVVSQTDALKNQIEKTTSELNNILPEQISTSVSDSYTTVDTIRVKAFTQLDVAKKETQKEINTLEAKSQKVSTNSDKKGSIEDATKKPITYIKLFLISFLAFIFGSKIIFYGIIIFLVFLIFRFIYRKIRNRY